MFSSFNTWVSVKRLKSVLCLALAAPSFVVTAQTSHQFAYVGNENGQTISGYLLNATTGQLTPLEGSPFTTNGAGLGSLVVDPAGRFLYITDQYGGTKNVTGFRIDRETGGLTALPGSPFNAGKVPSDIVIDPSGKFAFVADFEGGVSALKIDPHSGCLIPIGSYPAGDAPVALAVDPLGKFVYVVSDGIYAFSINPLSGALTKISGSPFPAGTNPRAVAVDPNDRFVYVGNYSSDNISGFTISPTTGALSALSTSPYAAGSGPVTSVTIDPTGAYLYAAGDDGVFAYSIDQNSQDFTGGGFPPKNLYGNLTPAKGSPFGGGTPYVVAVDYTGTFLYAANPLTDELSSFNLSNGLLQPTSSVPTGSGPITIALVRPRTLPLFKATMVAEPNDFGTVNSIQAVGVNDRGEVAGSVAYDATSEHFAEAFLFADGMSKGVAFSRVSTAGGLNVKGQVVGQQDVAPPNPLRPPPQAFLYSPSDNSTIDIDNIPDRESSALSINDAGHVTGFAYGGTCPPPFAVYPACLGNFNAFIYTGSGLKNLGTIGGSNSAGTSINNLGEIAGMSQVANGDSHLFLYRQDHMHDLGMPGGQAVVNAQLNDHGDILVTTLDTTGKVGSYLYNGHRFRKLPFLGMGINNATEIVGSEPAATAGSRAYVYFGGNSVDLNRFVDPSLPLLTTASGVSNNGNIVAYGLNGRLYVLSLR